ncbi:MAG: hypothetical protein QNK37_05465 [Acidobacteriota bacterium]|nr:hypothetical protein [Acidobacteriota bacterium]
MSVPRLQGHALVNASEEQVLKYLYTTDHPEWDYLRGHESFSEKWLILFLRRGRVIPRDAILEIYQNKEWRKSYRICLAMLRCKSAPPSLTMNLVGAIRWVDLMHTIRLPYLSGALRKRMVDEVMEVMPRLALGEKIAMARQAPRGLVKPLRLQSERRVIQALVTNSQFTYEDAMFMAAYPRIGESALGVLAASPRWNSFREIKLALLRNDRTPNSSILPLARTLNEQLLQSLLREGKLKLYTRRLIQRILEERFHQKRGAKPGRGHNTRKRY